MDYQQSLEYIFHAKEHGAKKNGLDNIKELLLRLGNPEALFPSVHVAGTNGKGSTCAMLESILRSAGLRTGLYTSPYLERFPERIRLNGAEIEEENFAALATEVKAAAEAMVRDGFTHPTFFELTTACCFLYYSLKKPDITVIETGLGGRTDATNVLNPLVCAITAIGMDHAHRLGGTLQSIASEKAGIIKPGVPCVLSAGNQQITTETISSAAETMGCKLFDCSMLQLNIREQGWGGQVFDLIGENFRFEKLRIPLLGGYQLQNAATAVQTALLLRCWFPIPDWAIAEGLASARWPGRMELLRRDPPLILDGAHNPHGAKALTDCLQPLLRGQKVCMVAGMMADKDAEPMVRDLARVAGRVLATEPPSHGRAARPPEDLAALFSSCGVPAEACSRYEDALNKALASGMPMLVCGSLYLVGAARTWLMAQAGLDKQ
jgi:dihydrofolate synthase/folylpolyglutamate synthase